MIKIKTKLIVTAILGLLFVSETNAQVYGTGYRVITFVDASRANRQVETLIYYPGDLSGFEVPLGSPSDKKFPVIVFGHDQQTAFNNYQYLWDGLVWKGFMVAFPLTEMGPSMDVTEFAKDLAFVAASFAEMRQDPNSFFYKRFNGKSCVMGHGYGGSAATLAVQYNAGITTLISLAARETAPGVAAAAAQITIPTVVIGGAEDCVAPIAGNQLPIYNALASDCKAFVSMNFASYCNYAQGEAGCVSTEVVCNGNQVPYMATNSLTNYLVVSFLRYYMKYNAPALNKFEWKLQRKFNHLTYLFDCNSNARVADKDLEEETPVTQMNMYPNPIASGNSINLTIPSEEALAGTVMISDMLGQIVYSKQVNFDEEINTLQLPTSGIRKGYYMVTVINEEGKTSKPLVID